jgi:hypothetical protein
MGRKTKKRGEEAQAILSISYDRVSLSISTIKVLKTAS